MNKNIIAFILAFNFTNICVVNAQDISSDMLTDLAIPLMEGLVEQTEEAVLFDSPEGRIINAQAFGSVNGADVYQYYLMVLPSLGWGIIGQNNILCADGIDFCLEATREVEKIILNIENKNNTSKVTYSLSPN
ncbi:MAG: hypothetical protein HOH19_10970 [Kordiimonadaceae bacterium]|jgi:hypothetical protein|nr:hypothetical protein [Kordiimonadaceae bacterium]MBT6033089.1 hypothetical protein [Kordiimonadaceae bacterium]